jgi:cell wall-associated NlpC family hydrolase
MKSSFSHVGIYLGDNKFIHSPRSGEQVRIDDMRSAYWQKRFNGARRVQTEDKNTPDIR